MNYLSYLLADSAITSHTYELLKCKILGMKWEFLYTHHGYTCLHYDFKGVKGKLSP